MVKVLGPSIYRIADCDNPRKRKEVHVNRLKPAPPQNTIEELGDDDIIVHSMLDLPLVGTLVGTNPYIGGTATGPTKSSSS